MLDEIQKIPVWSETVKRLWDEETRRKRPLKVVLLGSAPLLIAQGLTESLACPYSGQILSYTKMLGRLQDAGNTTTLAHYLELLAGIAMVCGPPNSGFESSTPLKAKS